jgi:SAM-dependent methyltransferase
MILDVGCGAQHRAEIRLDKRRTQAVNVIAHAEQLPFQDHVFTHVILSHILEHVEDPAQVLRECLRVGHTLQIRLPLYFYHHPHTLPWKLQCDRERTRLHIPFRIEFQWMVHATSGKVNTL